MRLDLHFGDAPRLHGSQSIGDWMRGFPERSTCRSRFVAMVIAIDGPAGAGKSTVARGLADELGITYLDSGAMYRCVALAVSRAGADPDDPRRRPAGVAGDLRSPSSPGGCCSTREDVSDAIRSPEISALASRVSVHPGVREAMVMRQRDLISRGPYVAEGRDIGTVVSPDAPLKVFLVADDEERARRRAAESDRPVDEVLADIADRDRRDTEREHGAMRAADDSIEVDTTVADRRTRSSRGSPRSPASVTSHEPNAANRRGRVSERRQVHAGQPPLAAAGRPWSIRRPASRATARSFPATGTGVTSS